MQIETFVLNRPQNEDSEFYTIDLALDSTFLEEICT